MKSIDTKQLQAMIESTQEFTLINTLSPEDFQKTQIPGSINIPQDKDNFVDEVEQEVGGKDSTVVVYCASEECPSSTKAAEKLEAAGFSDVMDYEGGARAWKEAGKSLAVNA